MKAIAETIVSTAFYIAGMGTGISLMLCLWKDDFELLMQEFFVLFTDLGLLWLLIHDPPLIYEDHAVLGWMFAIPVYAAMVFLIAAAGAFVFFIADSIRGMWKKHKAIKQSKSGQ